MSFGLPHAPARIADWRAAWKHSGGLIVLLDYDGTLSPIVARPELAVPSPGAMDAVAELRRRGAEVAIVSGRGLEDARERFGVSGIAYAGNHGMEIDGPGVQRVHGEAAAARPHLERAAERLRAPLSETAGALLEDKGLTLSIHYRQVAPTAVGEVRRLVTETVASGVGLRLTEGKMVLEIRPDVDWHKGKAVEFLVENFSPPPETPVLYLGDDTTDEDAFLALRRRNEYIAEGVLVSESPPASTSALSYVRDPREVVELLRALAAE